MKKKGRKSSGVKKPRKSKKSAKKSISASVPRSKNAYMYFLGEKRGEVRAALLAESEGGKVPVSEVTKKVGAMWKALDDVTKAPYTELAATAKAERDAKIAELTEAASKVEEEESVVSESTETVESTESAEEAALLMALKPKEEEVKMTGRRVKDGKGRHLQGTERDQQDHNDGDEHREDDWSIMELTAQSDRPTSPAAEYTTGSHASTDAASNDGPEIGQRVKVYWNGEGRHFQGTVTERDQQQSLDRDARAL